MSENWFQKLFIDDVKGALNRHSGGGGSGGESVTVEMKVEPVPTHGEHYSNYTIEGTDQVENIYFNTAASMEEAMDVIMNAVMAHGRGESFTICYDTPDDFCRLYVSATEEFGGVASITDYDTGEVYFAGMKNKDELPEELLAGLPDFLGWNPSFSGVIKGPVFIYQQDSPLTGEYKTDMISDEAAAVLASIVSLTPFDQAGASKQLSGTYDGSPVTVTENGTVDVSAMLDEQKLPLAVDVNVPIPDGYIVPEGSKTITENGTYDVTEFAEAVVECPEPAAVEMEVESQPVALPSTTGVAIDTVYFNTSLSVEETLEILHSTDPRLIYTHFGMRGEGYIYSALYAGGIHLFVDVTSQPYSIYASTSAFARYNKVFDGTTGWLVDSVSFGGAVTSVPTPPSGMLGSGDGNQNDLLVNIMSLTPFGTVKTQKQLTGAYDGAPLTVTENGTVDIGAMLDEQKLPLSVVVDVPSSGGEGATVEIPAPWVSGAPVIAPADGSQVDKIYINTALSKEEVINTIKNLFPDDGGEVVFQCSTTGSMVDIYYYAATQYMEERCGVSINRTDIFDLVNGWAIDAPSVLEGPFTLRAQGAYAGNGEYVGTNQAQYSSLIAIPPLEFSEPTIKPLSGTYDGAPLTVKANGTVDIGAMLDAHKLPAEIAVKVSPAVTYENYDMMEIPNYMFINSTFLSEVIITNVSTIGEMAFCECKNLTTLTFSSPLESIGGWAFDGCTNLTSITYYGSKEQWKAINFGDGWDNNTGDYIVTCDDGTIAKDGTET